MHSKWKSPSQELWLLNLSFFPSTASPCEIHGCRPWCGIHRSVADHICVEPTLSVRIIADRSVWCVRRYILNLILCQMFRFFVLYFSGHYHTWWLSNARVFIPKGASPSVEVSLCGSAEILPRCPVCMDPPSPLQDPRMRAFVLGTYKCLQDYGGLYGAPVYREPCC